MKKKQHSKIGVAELERSSLAKNGLLSMAYGISGWTLAASNNFSLKE